MTQLRRQLGSERLDGARSRMGEGMSATFLQRSTRTRALFAGVLGVFLSSPAHAIDSVVHGAVTDVSAETSAAGDALMAEFGAEWAGIHSDRPGRWLIDWDLLAAVRAGVLANQPQLLTLLGGHVVAWGQIGFRTSVAGPWSPYVGSRLGGDLLVMVHPGVSLSAPRTVNNLSTLNTVNNMDGVGGLVASGVVGLELGASMLEPDHSLRMVAIVQESLHSSGTYTPGFAFTDVGLGVRFDVAQSITTSVDVVVGAAHTRSNASLGYTDQTLHGRLDFGLRKIFHNGMWLGVGLTAERYPDEIAYTPGASYTTADAFTFSLVLSFGFPLWRKAP
jgi:hypothetical protein